MWNGFGKKMHFEPVLRGFFVWPLHLSELEWIGEMLGVCMLFGIECKAFVSSSKSFDCIILSAKSVLLLNVVIFYGIIQNTEEHIL